MGLLLGCLQYFTVHMILDCLEGKVQTLNSDLQALRDLPQAATPLLFSEYPTFLCSSN